MDNKRKIENLTIKRAKFFQTVHAWPDNEEFNYKGWLTNFKTEKDKELACLILDFFICYSEKMVNKMFTSAIEKAGAKLAQLIPDWQHSDFYNRCIYSYIPGEQPNISDSGFNFASKLKNVLDVPEVRLFDYMQIPKVLDSLGKPTPVILVDDFIGSGAQCSKAWNNNVFVYNNKTLKEISIDGRHIFIYAPLIVNSIGYERIKRECPDLFLTPTHILGPEYNLFNPECFCWKGDPILYASGVEMILRKSSEIGIPSTNGKHTQDEKGFGMQGLALKFSHGAPDAIPSFFYWCHNNWVPLFKKTYTR